MNLYGIDIYCEHCKLIVAETIDKEQKDDSWNWQWECPDCNGQMKRIFGAPMITKASYVDGIRKRGDSSYQKLLEASKLESEMYSLPVEQRGKISQEIRQLKRIK